MKNFIAQFSTQLNSSCKLKMLCSFKQARMKNLLANKIDEHSFFGQATHCEIRILEHWITTLYIKCRKTREKSTMCLINKSTLIELILIQHAIVI